MVRLVAIRHLISAELPRFTIRSRRVENADCTRPISGNHGSLLSMRAHVYGAMRATSSACSEKRFEKPGHVGELPGNYVIPYCMFHHSTSLLGFPLRLQAEVGPEYSRRHADPPLLPPAPSRRSELQDARGIAVQRL